MVRKYIKKNSMHRVKGFGKTKVKVLGKTAKGQYKVRPKTSKTHAFVSRSMIRK